MLEKENTYNQLIDKIGDTYTIAKSKAGYAINTELIQAYWHIGKYIVEFEQSGYLKADTVINCY